jgi:hypothetical protein
MLTLRLLSLLSSIMMSLATVMLKTSIEKTFQVKMRVPIKIQTQNPVHDPPQVLNKSQTHNLNQTLLKRKR